MEQDLIASSLSGNLIEEVRNTHIPCTRLEYIVKTINETALCLSVVYSFHALFSTFFKRYSVIMAFVVVVGSQSQRSIRLFSQQSRRQWNNETLSDKGKASRTAWPVSQIEGLFLPDFPVKPEINEDHFEVSCTVTCGFKHSLRQTNQIAVQVMIFTY